MRYTRAILCAFIVVPLAARADEPTPWDWDDPKLPSQLTASAYREGRSAPQPQFAAASQWFPTPPPQPPPPPAAREEPPTGGKKVEAPAAGMLDRSLFRRGGEAPAGERHAAPGSLFAGEDGEISNGKRSTLSPDAVQGAVRPHMGEVRFCFQKAQQDNPALEGRVFVRFTVAPSGQVTTSDVESSTIDHPAVEKCLVSAVRRWTFPKPTGAGSATVSWPFKLVALQ